MNILLWALQIILAVKFVSAGYTHGLRPDPAKMQRGMQRFGAAMRPLLIAIAVCMFLGAGALIFPAATGVATWLTPWSAALLALLMLAAIGFHVACREKPLVVADLILAVLAAMVAYWAVGDRAVVNLGRVLCGASATNTNGTKMGRPMTPGQTRRNVLLVLLGIAALVLKPYYGGPFSESVYSYAGNFAVSFSVYFMVAIAASRFGLGRAAVGVSSFLLVEAFEVTNGFWVMSNVYDPVDLLANAAGIGAAVIVDLATWRFVSVPGEDIA